MNLPEIKVNRTVFVKNYIWYLSIVYIHNKPCAFWSHHKMDGLSPEKAAKYFERAHMKEVGVLVRQKIENESLINN